MSEDQVQALPPRGNQVAARKRPAEPNRPGLKEAGEALDAYALAHPAAHRAAVVELGAGRWLFLLLVLGASLAWMFLGDGPA
ncbi:MAG: hypothetical protein V4812_19725 [Pseudomonadota bacterium]